MAEDLTEDLSEDFIDEKYLFDDLNEASDGDFNDNLDDEDLCDDDLDDDFGDDLVVPESPF